MMKAEFFMARFGALHALIHEEKAFGSNICAEKSGDQQALLPKSLYNSSNSKNKCIRLALEDSSLIS